MVLVAKFIVSAISLVVLPRRIKLITCISAGIVGSYTGCIALYPFGGCIYRRSELPCYHNQDRAIQPLGKRL